MGLSTTFEHPELVVVDVHVGAAQSMLDALGDLVRSGTRLRPGDEVEADGMTVRIGAVQEAHIAHGLVNMALEYRTLARTKAAPLEVLQVTFPPEAFCHEHEHSDPDLSEPTYRNWN